MSLAEGVKLSPGDDLFRVAAEYYRDAPAWTLIARANNLSDPYIEDDIIVVIPNYNSQRENDGILAST